MPALPCECGVLGNFAGDVASDAGYLYFSAVNYVNNFTKICYPVGRTVIPAYSTLSHLLS